MATQTRSEQPTVMRQTIDLAAEYAIVVYPLLFGAAVLVLGLLLQATGSYVAAGVAGALGLIICLITVVVYLLFWLLGRYGH